MATINYHSNREITHNISPSYVQFSNINLIDVEPLKKNFRATLTGNLGPFTGTEKGQKWPHWILVSVVSSGSEAVYSLYLRTPDFVHILCIWEPCVSTENSWRYSTVNFTTFTLSVAQGVIKKQRGNSLHTLTGDSDQRCMFYPYWMIIVLFLCCCHDKEFFF